MKWFQRASDRDKGLAIRMLSELRSIERGMLQNAASEFAQRVARVSGQTDAMEVHVITLLQDGANLDPSLANYERRAEVERARSEVAGALAAFEMQRQKAQKAVENRAVEAVRAGCEHDLAPSGACTKCGLVPSVPAVAAETA